MFRRHETYLRCSLDPFPVTLWLKNTVVLLGLLWSYMVVFHIGSKSRLAKGNGLFPKSMAAFA